jgi:octaprenyl-diphosphate synthase
MHDDVMDEAERRRAQPTANARWGNSLSVLLGDCLFAHALTLSTSLKTRTLDVHCAHGCNGLLRRNDPDAAQIRSQPGRSGLLAIVEMKTGSLFSVAAELAAVISEADPGVIERFKNFGFQIGTAYQIYDRLC